MESPTRIQEQKRIFTRSRLKDAARTVFAAKGYVGATVDDIASAAGASRATFYLHFPSKHGIVADMLVDSEQHALGQYRELDDLLASTARDKRAQLREWLRGWLQHWRDHASANPALMGALMGDPEIEREMVASGERYVDAMTQFLRAQPKARREKVRAQALMLETMTRSVFALAARGLCPASDDVLLDYLTDLWAGIFLPKADGHAGRAQSRVRERAASR